MMSSEDLQSAVDTRVVLDALAHAVVTTDAEGRILLWNRAAEHLYGWVEHEVLGRSVLDVLTPPQQAESDLEDLRRVASGSKMTGDRLVADRDGNAVLVHTFTSPIVGPDGATVALVGSSEDVGDRRAVEQRARDLTEQLQLALRAGGLGTWRWDMATGETIWDERLEALFGLAAGGFDGTFDTYVSLLHPDDRASVLERVDEAIRTKSTYRVEHRVVWPDGSVHWIDGVGGVTLDEQGNVTGTVGCTMDVTDRVEQELERRRLADLAAQAGENERIQRERLEFLVQVNEALSSSMSVRDVMRKVAGRVVPRLGDWCAIHVLPTDGRPWPDVEVAHVDPAMVELARDLQARFPYDPDAPTGVPAVIRTGITEFYPALSPELLSTLDVSTEAVELVRQLDLASVITVAIKKRKRIVGAMQFIRTSHSRPYTIDDVALAEALTGRIASSIENLRLHDEQRAIAHTLQASLLPATLPDIAGIDVAVRYWPNGEAAEVGGDFYDLFAVTDDHFAVVMGDVCGTGPAAAALTGLARHTIRDSAWHGDDHGGVLRSLNRAVRRSDADTFVTCVYASIEPHESEMTLTVSCGGHPPPVHVSASGGSTVCAPGTLLGAFDEIEVLTTTVGLAPGDVVVFYTDGATDVPPPHHLDEQAWVDLVTSATRDGAKAEDIAHRIHVALESILPFASRYDDVALLVLTVAEP